MNKSRDCLSHINSAIIKIYSRKEKNEVATCPETTCIFLWELEVELQPNWDRMRLNSNIGSWNHVSNAAAALNGLLKDRQLWKLERMLTRRCIIKCLYVLLLSVIEGWGIDEIPALWVVSQDSRPSSQNVYTVVPRVSTFTPTSQESP